MKTFAKAILTFIALYFIQSCTPQKTANQNLYKQWMLVEFKGYAKQELMKHQAHIDLSPRKAPANQYFAEMGCNKIYFTAKFGSKDVTISNVTSTMMYCEDMQLEEDFAKAFPNVKHYEIQGLYLTLRDDQGHSMKFVASDWD